MRTHPITTNNNNKQQDSSKDIMQPPLPLPLPSLSRKKRAQISYKIHALIDDQLKGALTLLAQFTKKAINQLGKQGMNDVQETLTKIFNRKKELKPDAHGVYNFTVERDVNQLEDKEIVCIGEFKTTGARLKTQAASYELSYIQELADPEDIKNSFTDKSHGDVDNPLSLQAGVIPGRHWSNIFPKHNVVVTCEVDVTHGPDGNSIDYAEEFPKGKNILCGVVGYDVSAHRLTGVHFGDFLRLVKRHDGKPYLEKNNNGDIAFTHEAQVLWDDAMGKWKQYPQRNPGHVVGDTYYLDIETLINDIAVQQAHSLLMWIKRGVTVPQGILEGVGVFGAEFYPLYQLAAAIALKKAIHDLEENKKLNIQAYIISECNEYNGAIFDRVFSCNTEESIDELINNYKSNMSGKNEEIFRKYLNETCQIKTPIVIVNNDTKYVSHTLQTQGLNTGQKDARDLWEYGQFWEGGGSGEEDTARRTTAYFINHHQLNPKVTDSSQYVPIQFNDLGVNVPKDYLEKKIAFQQAIKNACRVPSLRVEQSVEDSPLPIKTLPVSTQNEVKTESKNIIELSEKLGSDIGPIDPCYDHFLNRLIRYYVNEENKYFFQPSSMFGKERELFERYKYNEVMQKFNEIKTNLKEKFPATTICNIQPDSSESAENKTALIKIDTTSWSEAERNSLQELISLGQLITNLKELIESELTETTKQLIGEARYTELINVFHQWCVCPASRSLTHAISALGRSFHSIIYEKEDRRQLIQFAEALAPVFRKKEPVTAEAIGKCIQATPLAKKLQQLLKENKVYQRDANNKLITMALQGGDTKEYWLGSDDIEKIISSFPENKVSYTSLDEGVLNATIAAKKNTSSFYLLINDQSALNYDGSDQGSHWTSARIVIEGNKIIVEYADTNSSGRNCPLELKNALEAAYPGKKVEPSKENNLPIIRQQNFYECGYLSTYQIARWLHRDKLLLEHPLLSIEFKEYKKDMAHLRNTIQKMSLAKTACQADTIDDVLLTTNPDKFEKIEEKEGKFKLKNEFLDQLYGDKNKSTSLMTEPNTGGDVKMGMERGRAVKLDTQWRPVYLATSSLSKKLERQEASRTSCNRKQLKNDVKKLQDGLASYIRRIEENKKNDKIDFAHGFCCIFRHSRAENREKNYNVAINLLKQLNNITEVNDIVGNISQYKSDKLEKVLDDAGECGSSELNKIIDCARKLVVLQRDILLMRDLPGVMEKPKV